MDVTVDELLAGRASLSIDDPRQTTVELHTHLRELIISGVFPPGTELKQAELARIFAVSRTPMREAFRMLQEEGLVSAAPNQRSRVVGLVPEELELLYAARISLESMGVRLTAGRLGRAEDREASSALREMDRTYRSGELTSWAVAHRRFHQQMVSRCGSTVLRTISSYAAQSERYIRSDQSRHRRDYPARRREHVAILEAVRTGAVRDAVRLNAEHLAGTACRVMESTAPGHSMRAVVAAVELVTGTTDWAPVGG